MWIRPFNNHKIVKDKLLKAINDIPKSPINHNIDDKISHTDFYLPGDIRREYLDIFYDSIKQHMITLCNDFHSKNWKIFSSWFQQYYQGDAHGWHNHGESQFAGVYYLEMPNKSMTTEFLDGSKIEAKEGDILIFPSYKYHRSKKNNSKKRKTIIAFNVSFDVWNGKKIV
jgi:hypothetical protein